MSGVGNTALAASTATTIQTDIGIATLVAAAIVLVFGLLARGHRTTAAPTGIPLLWEMSVDAADRAAGSVPAKVRSRVTGTAVTLFWFVAVSNWLHLIPGSPLPAPTSDINLTLALAVTAMGVVHLTALQSRGPRGYLRHYLSPWWLAPVKILEELIKPLTLALRLFGMLFASALMVVLIGEILPAPAAVVPHVLWTLFDVFIGAIQAFIFALLTILYFQAVLPSDARPSAVKMTPNAAADPAAAPDTPVASRV
jgi:F-type H+-transporting ATPase subunit a